MLSAGRDFNFFNPFNEVDMSRANLPHWQQQQALYFVTFRLADSIPQEKLSIWKSEYENWLIRNPQPWTTEQREEYETHFVRRIELWLDSGHDNCLLRQQNCKQIVLDCLNEKNGRDYLLDTLTVAANHVHALVVPVNGVELSTILRNWKGKSARLINLELKRSGSTWQKESYDYIVRNAEALERIRKYIRAHEQT